MNLLMASGIVLMLPLAVVLAVFVILWLFAMAEEFRDWWCDGWEEKTTIILVVLGIIGAILFCLGLR